MTCWPVSVCRVRSSMVFPQAGGPIAEGSQQPGDPGKTPTVISLPDVGQNPDAPQSLPVTAPGGSSIFRAKAGAGLTDRELGRGIVREVLPIRIPPLDRIHGALPVGPRQLLFRGPAFR